MACGCLDCDGIQVPIGPQGPQGPQGNPGTNGADGVDGTSVLHNDITDSSTVGTSLEILKTYTLPANTLDTDDSFIKVNARFRTNTSTSALTSTKEVGIYFDGSQVIIYEFLKGNVDVVEFELIFSRFSNTILKVKSARFATQILSNVVCDDIVNGWSNTAGLDLTTTAYPITIRANSDVIGDLTCESLTVTKYKK